MKNEHLTTMTKLFLQEKVELSNHSGFSKGRHLEEE
jgi:hypothetical protein